MSCATAATTTSTPSSSASASASASSSSSPGGDLNHHQKLTNLNKTISLIRNIKEERQQAAAVAMAAAPVPPAKMLGTVNKRKPTVKKLIAADLVGVAALANGTDHPAMDVDDENMVDADDELEEGNPFIISVYSNQNSVS